MARLYVLVARQARRAVVFRRGPSKQVLLLSWDLDTDRLREGQWLKGRIYERRCDLSPSGERLVYFAASQKPPYRTWTAVSRPPWLTALALWPSGDTWGGGGLFAAEDLLELWGVLPPRVPAQGSVPRRVTVGELHTPAGVYLPILEHRLRRDGWTLSGTSRRRQSPKGRAALTCELLGIGPQDQEPWQRERYALEFAEGTVDIGVIDWADWDRGGDLLLAREGRLLRLPRGSLRDPSAAVEVADLRALKFEPRESPLSARAW